MTKKGSGTYAATIGTLAGVHVLTITASSPASALDAAMAMPGTLWASVA